MKFFVYAGIAIGTLWLQLTVAPLLSLFGYKPNLPLLCVLVIGLRWQEPWLFLYAVFAGLALDAFSHGVLGVYGLSLFAISFLARQVGQTMYGNSLLVGVASVFGISLLEGLLSVSLLEMLDDTVPWWFWMATRVLPGALVNALWSPVAFYALGRLERWVNFSEA